jgi:two-component system LytT family response regulator
MYKAIIIDDEEMARSLLKEMINEFTPSVTVNEVCKDLPSGVKAIRKHKPDIVFLDIEMPGHSGLELLDFFNEDEVGFSIIFVTAYNEYAIHAFKMSAIYYLLKPVEADDLKDAVALFEKNKLKQNYSVLKDNLTGTGSQKIGLTTLNSISFLETADILFFEAEGAYTKVVLKTGKPVMVSKGLKNFETMLSQNQDFFRCHKSYIVNVRHITDYLKVNGGSLMIDRNYEISVSPDKLESLLKLTGKFL